MAEESHKLKRWLPVIVAVVIVAAGLGVPYGLGIVTFMHGQNTQNTANVKPVTIPFGKFYEISNVDYAPASQVNVYLSSWYGCPIGAADSWMLLDYFSQYVNMSSSIQLNKAPFANDTAVPGLLFRTFSYVHAATNDSSKFTVNFYPYYLYNLYLNATADGLSNVEGGTPINSSQLVSTGLSELNFSGIPDPIVRIVQNITTVDRLSGTNTSSAFLYSPHKINTVMVITGPGGTWILNMYVIDPGSLTSYTPQYMLDHYATMPSVISAEASFASAMTDASSPPTCV
jgi:hypothetical protein